MDNIEELRNIISENKSKNVAIYNKYIAIISSALITGLLSFERKEIISNAFLKAAIISLILSILVTILEMAYLIEKDNFYLNGCKPTKISSLFNEKIESDLILARIALGSFLVGFILVILYIINL